MFDVCKMAIELATTSPLLSSSLPAGSAVGTAMNMECCGEEAGKGCRFSFLKASCTQRLLMLALLLIAIAEAGYLGGFLQYVPNNEETTALNETLLKTTETIKKLYKMINAFVNQTSL